MISSTARRAHEQAINAACARVLSGGSLSPAQAAYLLLCANADRAEHEQNVRERVRELFTSDVVTWPREYSYVNEPADSRALK